MENFEGVVNQKVDPRNNSYREKISQSAEQMIVNKTNVFGASVLSEVGKAGREDKQPKEIESARDFLRNLQKGISQPVTETERRYKPILDLIEEGRLANPAEAANFDEAKKRLLDTTKNDSQDQELPDFISPDLITDAAFIKMLEAHQKSFEKRSNEIMGRIPELRKSFASYIKEFVLSQGIDMPQDLIDERISDTPVVIVDSLLSARDDYVGAHSRGIISLSSAISDQRLIKTFTHEMLHALGGKLVLENGQGGDFKVLREGLRFNGKRFRWLEEAVTESLTDKIRPGDHPTYENERRILEIIRTYGKSEIPESVFYNAFFENYDPSLPVEQRIPNWKKLWASVNEAFEPGFLVHVDEAMLYFGSHYTEHYLLYKLKGAKWEYGDYTKRQLDKIFGTQPEDVSQFEQVISEEIAQAA